MTPQQPANYLDQGSGAYLRAQLQSMQNNGIYAHMVSADQTQVWDADQLALQRKINDLAKESNSGVDPESLTGADEFEHLTLEQIRDLTDQIKPTVVQAVSEAWTKIGQSLGEATKTLSDGLKATIAENWQGQAAGRASQAIAHFVDTSTNVGTAASMVGMKVAFAQRGSDETSRMLGPVLAAAVPTAPAVQIPGTSAVQTPIPGSLAALVPTMAGVQSAESQKEEARQASLQVLRNVYAPAMHGGDQGVPVLPSVQQSTNPTGPLAPTSIAPGSATPSTATAPSATTQHSDTTADQQQPNPADNTQPTSTDPAQNSGSQATTPAGTAGAADSASSINPNSTTTAGLGGGAGSGGGLSYSGSGAGGGLGGSDGESSRPNGPGSSVPGKSASATSAGAAVGASRAGTTNSSGMSPGMLGQGKGGNSEDDKEHKSSDLLRGQHLDEWIGDGQQVLPAFGAIGAQAPSAQSPEDEPAHRRPPGPPPSGRVQGEYR